MNPDLDPIVVDQTSARGSGIFGQAEYMGSSDFRKTAAVMKLVIDGNAAAGTIEMGGFDYHSGNRADGEGKDFNLGNCIGAVLEYAARKGKPVMIYVFTDGSLASNGMIDSSVAGRGKGVWTADNQSVAATYFLVYNPTGPSIALSRLYNSLRPYGPTRRARRRDPHDLERHGGSPRHERPRPRDARRPTRRLSRSGRHERGGHHAPGNGRSFGAALTS